ncbi:S8 family serine peptidase [Paraburkholderia sp. MMS20-SJTN17]|uniref:S8 family serine peptidase n=1 Tax=Paraburkholderia translucens TaxID=2886945 RepID=A0ABS8KCF0_9BURK|nr:S8 family serine peptidase [Paraburkholderia sp. MMS20-SJTN17]MCC8402403.1 S8 family serine peptidase [Paraburkholderia sp. MMS20-SJTN17]
MQASKSFRENEQPKNVHFWPGRLCRQLAVSGCAVLLVAACGGGLSSNASGGGEEPGHPGDPLVMYQWYLQNVGQDVFTGVPGTPGIDLDVMGPLGQGINGLGVNVMVVDSGTEIAHPDLKDRINPSMLRNFDPLAADANDPTPPVGSVDDAHGTAAAGIIAATADNGIGGHGVAPRATLGAARFLCTNCQTPVNLISIFGGAPFSQNVAVFNGSYGSAGSVPLEFDLANDFQSILLQHLETMRGGLGALLVQSAGNEFESATEESEEQEGVVIQVDCRAANTAAVTCVNANFDPGRAMPQVAAVAAVNALGKRSSYSSGGSNILVSGLGGEYGLGPTNTVGAPPGPALVTTDLTGCNQGYARTQAAGPNANPFDVPGSQINSALNPDCDYTASMNGTSAAAPTVSGVVALILQANPALTWRDIRWILMKTARRIDTARVPPSVELTSGQAYVPEPAWTQNAAGNWFDNWYGFGLVDAAAAVNMARQYNTHLAGSMLANTASEEADRQQNPGGQLVPQGTASGLAIPLNVTGSAQVVEYVQVSINMVSADLSDLAVEVISPGGTRSVLQNAYNGFANTGRAVSNWLLASNAFNGEGATGTWTVRFVDVDTRNGAQMGVESVTLNVLGH